MSEYKALVNILMTSTCTKTTSFVWNIHYIKSDLSTIWENVGIGPAIIVELCSGDEIFDVYIISYTPILGDVTSSLYKKDGGTIWLHTEHISQTAHVFESNLVEAFYNHVSFITKSSTIAHECIADIRDFVKNDVLGYLNTMNEDSNS